MGKQTKKKLAILLAFCLVILLTAMAVSTGQAAYQDKEWYNSAYSHLITTLNEYNELVNASSNKDMPNLRVYGTALNTDCQKALIASKSYSVSPSIQPAKNEYETAMFDLSQMGIYNVKGATEFQNGESEQSSKDFNTAAFYSRSSFTHFENCYKLLLRNKSLAEAP